MQFGDKPLFENVSIKFSNGNRYGLIGANGSGKSTFMKILSGTLKPSGGNVSVDPDIRVATLGQNQFAFEEYSVIDTVIMGNKELWDIKAERNRIYGLAEMSEEDGLKVADLEIAFGEMDGYTAESRASELLSGLEIPESQHSGSMSAVAPGWKLRVLLAQVLFADPDVLLLDEPTNNLDINTIRWLEKIINERKSTMVIISHDRHFLNSVCTHMADLDYGEIKLFPGNYDEYMTAATQSREQTQNENAKKKVKIAELQAFVSRFSANASKAKQATSRAKQLDKIKLAEIKPSSRINPYILFEQNKELKRHPLEVKGLSKSYDKSLFRDLDLMVKAGECIAIIGPNGSGKTTLLKCLAEQIQPDSGSVKWSENADIGYFSQDHTEDFAEDMNLFEWISQWRDKGVDDQAIRGVLGRLLFSKPDSEKSVKVISGGEQGRMLFGKLMLTKPNILLMDEPTNHLDMESIESLNLALENYAGTLFFVSHDREFVSSLATQIIELSDNELIHYVGNYEEYLASQKVVLGKVINQ